MLENLLLVSFHCKAVCFYLKKRLHRESSVQAGLSSLRGLKLNALNVWASMELINMCHDNMIAMMCAGDQNTPTRFPQHYSRSVSQNLRFIFM